MCYHQEDVPDEYGGHAEVRSQSCANYLLIVSPLRSQRPVMLGSTVLCFSQKFQKHSRLLSIFLNVTPTGDETYNDSGLIPRTIRLLKDKYPDLIIYTDVALDPYSSDGHDGIVREDGVIMNDEIVRHLCKHDVSQGTIIDDKAAGHSRNCIQFKG
ncbi:unnamed protein product [Lactuca saligna]|uniref:porphobilinogen synthase n=1 Tax=Lactuca saligna TaxID=75948 RepID=A0AA35UX07_LACSI|nr:unnamed protein product [Lactuca saligna]